MPDDNRCERCDRERATELTPYGLVDSALCYHYADFQPNENAKWMSAEHQRIRSAAIDDCDTHAVNWRERCWEAERERDEALSTLAVYRNRATLYDLGIVAEQDLRRDTLWSPYGNGAQNDGVNRWLKDDELPRIARNTREECEAAVVAALTRAGLLEEV